MRTIESKLGKLRGGKSLWGIILFCGLTAVASQAQVLTTLASFNGANGAQPLGLIQGFDGNLYGTTLDGGTQNMGTAFKVTPAGTLTTLHSFGFCSAGCLDGIDPEGRLTQASNGDLYDPTDFGGTSGAGIIYRITSAGEYEVLYNFCTVSSCPDGASPISLLQGRNGNLYGTANGYRLPPDLGTVFELTLGGVLTTLHSFSGPDGANPQGALLQASNGNFYGTTTQGGSSTICGPLSLPRCGTIFQITPSGTLTTLHIFTGTDGALPGYGGSLVEGSDENLYGTASFGGNSQCTSGCGTIFKISAAGKFTTLYNFCSQTNCADGANPVESLVQGTDGNIYGTTVHGGNSYGGTLFRLSPQGVLTTLYNFCSLPNCADGAGPQAALIQDTDGNFYGTTAAGYPSNAGTVFRFSIGLGPFVKLVLDAGKVGQDMGIFGQGLTGTTSVFVNGIPASFKVLSDTVIRAIVPAGAKSGFVTVDTPGGTLKSNVPFRVTL